MLIVRDISLSIACFWTLQGFLSTFSLLLKFSLSPAVLTTNTRYPLTNLYYCLSPISWLVRLVLEALDKLQKWLQDKLQISCRSQVLSIFLPLEPTTFRLVHLVCLPQPNRGDFYFFSKKNKRGDFLKMNKFYIYLPSLSVPL